MFVLARSEMVKRIAGREWRRGSPPAQGAAQSAVLKTESAVQMHGPAGTGFVEDPYGFHTGTSVTGAARLILEIEYGVARTLGRTVLRAVCLSVRISIVLVESMACDTPNEERRLWAMR
jgi:hypothetical protein